MIIQRAIENRYSMIVIVPAKIKRKLGWLKGDYIQVWEKNGVVSFQKVKMTNVKYKQAEGGLRSTDPIKQRNQSKVSGDSVEPAASAEAGSKRHDG